MAAPVLTQIRNEIKAMISAMTTAGGYRFTWAAVNPSFFSAANLPAQSATIFALVEDNEETNFDSFGAVNGGMYGNDVEFIISAFPRPNPPAGVPFIDVCDEAIDLAVEDLKKLFGNKPCINGKAFNSLYSGSRKVFTHKEDIPCFVEFRLVVRYRQDRRDPARPA
jgi:hypothetical protein